MSLGIYSQFVFLLCLRRNVITGLWQQILHPESHTQLSSSTKKKYSKPRRRSFCENVACGRAWMPLPAHIQSVRAEANPSFGLKLVVGVAVKPSFIFIPALRRRLRLHPSVSGVVPDKSPGPHISSIAWLAILHTQSAAVFTFRSHGSKKEVSTVNDVLSVKTVPAGGEVGGTLSTGSGQKCPECHFLCASILLEKTRRISSRFTQCLLTPCNASVLITVFGQKRRKQHH